MSGLTAILKALSPIKPQRVQTRPRAIDEAERLRGGVQPNEQLLQQLRGRQGVKASDLGMWGHLQPGERLSPLQLAAQARPMPLYAQRGGNTKHDLQDAMYDLAFTPQFDGLRAEAAALEMFEDLPRRLQRIATNILDNGIEQVSAADIRRFNRGVETFADDEGIDLFFDVYANDPQFYQVLDATATKNATRKFGPEFSDYQRQDKAKAIEDSGGGYFETVLRGPASYERSIPATAKPGNHFGNNSQLGHIRGTADQNQMLIEEVQSDPIENLGAKFPGLENVYGKLGNMVVDRAAAANIPSVIMPSAARIAEARPNSSAAQKAFFEQLYNKEMKKSLFDPLHAKGVPIYENEGWKSFDMSPEFLEAVRRGEILRYKQGGLAKVGST